MLIVFRIFLIYYEIFNFFYRPEGVREFFQSRGCVYNDTTADWILEGNPDQPCEGSIIHSWYQWVPYVLLFQVSTSYTMAKTELLYPKNVGT